MNIFVLLYVKYVKYVKQFIDQLKNIMDSEDFDDLMNDTNILSDEIADSDILDLNGSKLNKAILINWLKKNKNAIM